jgi:hypothetical protein
MNYDLAKQLKDVGFPQGGKGNWMLPPDKIVARSHDRVYEPTLEELIGACGDKFHSLVSVHKGAHKSWQACAETDGLVSGEGGTPTEAIAYLWLALNSNRHSL